MSITELLAAVGGLAGVLGGLTAFAKFIAEKSAEAGLKRFEHTLKQAEADHESALRRLEAEFGAKLRRIEEEHRASLQFASALDLDLRSARKTAYADLWSRTKAVPKWPRDPSLSYEGLRALSEAMRDWYFAGGGMLLSRTARAAYGDAQGAIHACLGPHKSGPVSDADYDRVRDALSTLRTELTDDLLTRREAPALPAGVAG